MVVDAEGQEQPAPPRVTTPRSRPKPPKPSTVPGTARAWRAQLATLHAQLVDERSPVAREHYHHRQLYDDLVRIVTALGKAHPGGLDALSNPRSRR